MKKISLLLLTLATFLFITSCEKDKTGPFLNESAEAPEITAPTGGTTFVLLEVNENNTLATFKWTEPDYGFKAAVLYALEIDKAGNNFEDAINVANSPEPELTVKIADFNMKVLTIGGIAGEEASYEIRVSATINENLTTLVSTPLILKITPYEKIIIYPKLYVPGDQNGWNEKDENSVISSVKSNDIYEGYLWFKDATTGFKLLKVPAWEEANSIGDPMASGTSGTLQIGSWGGNNIIVNGGIGYYLIKANLIEKTYSWLKTEWGIIGPAQPGGWDNDSNMTYSVATGLWTTTLDLVAGVMKFRANDAWTINYGDTGADRKLDFEGADIPVAVTGNYTVTLDLRGPIYKYSIVKN